MRVAVIGIGQSTRGDDAVGPQAVRMWRRLYPKAAGGAKIRVLNVEQPGLDLLDALEGIDAAVLVDAIQSEGNPGRVRQLTLEDLDSEQSRKHGMHGWAIPEILELGFRLEQLRSHLVVRVVGIEAEQADVGAALSDRVRKALPAACASIQTQVQTYLSS